MPSMKFAYPRGKMTFKEKVSQVKRGVKKVGKTSKDILKKGRAMVLKRMNKKV